ncbi:MAG: type IV toxin-antitoxin system AbiEi family antitoxin [Alphaproteobacteria bacterium]|nr:type IV toxin-antitoxin system AbiEi family antitoxin [Alphaproteobacteria bacterium]
MKAENIHLGAKEYIASLAASGRYQFASSDAQSALGISAAAAKLALNRLAKQGEIASPVRGFYVIVPPEYRSLGSLPADQFIPGLMKSKNQTYYAGLLSAAQYHGAAHHRPQEFQVMLSKNRRPIQCGAVRVAFMARTRIAEVPVQDFNTPRGTVRVSTPEATAIDLVGYQRHVGDLDHVATILSELVEKIDPQKLANAAETAPVPWAQRLGYLMEHIGAGEKTLPLKSYVRQHARQSVVLLPAASLKRARRDESWKLYINATVAAEL